MPVTKELLTKISSYESQGYNPDDIVEGLRQSANYPDIAKKIDGYRGDGYKSDQILQGIKQSPVSEDIRKVLKGVPEWAGRYPTLYGILGATKEVARFAAETSAMVAGGIVGGFAAGPTGAVIGAGIAGAGVKVVERQLEGEPQDKKQFAYDVATFGLGGEGGSQIISRGATRLFGPVRKTLTNTVTGQINKETEAYIASASRTGYTPTAAEITSSRSKGIALIEGMLSYLPGSAGTIQRARMANLDKLISLRSELLNKGANEASIESVGYRIKREAQGIVENALKRRGNVQKEQVDAIVNRFTNEVNATHSPNTREQGLSSVLIDFYEGTGTAPSLSSAGKSVQDMMGQVKSNRYAEAGAKLDAVEKELGSHNVPMSKSQQVADDLIKQELKSSYPDPAVIRALRPYASRDLPLNEEIKKLFPNEEAIKRNQEVYDALMSELGGQQKTWSALNLDRQKLGALARKENQLTGTDYASSKGSTTPAGRNFTILRSAIEEDMGAYAQKANPDAYKTFMEGRKQWWETEQLFDNDALGLMKKSPEDVFKSIVNPGEVENVRKLKDMLGEKDFQPFKEIFTRKLIATDKNGILDVAKTKANINKYGETFNEVFSKDEQSKITSMINRADAIEKDFAKSKALKDIWVTDGNGNVRVEATKRNFAKKREELSKHYTDEELTKLESSIGSIEKINLRNIARNKSEAIEFLSTVSGVSNEGVVRAIVKPNNTINIKYMKRLLGPERAKEVETKFVENYLMELNQHGAFSPATASRKFKQYDKTMRQLMDKQTYAEISDLMRLNRNAAMLERLASNPSQTGQTLIGFETGKEVVRSLTFSMLAGGAVGGTEYYRHGNPITAATYASLIAFGPYGAAKLYLSPVGRKYLSVGYTIPAESKEAMELLTKMAVVAGVTMPSAPEQEEPKTEE